MNYTKIVGQFVCKMAMPLALMFAACSTEDGNAVSKVDGTPGTEMGGASDEPRIVAYEKISLSARAYYAPAGNEAVRQKMFLFLFQRMCSSMEGRSF